jgi:uncharacterized protein (DUF58 family)
VGDDLRHVDWNAYARSDHLFVKLYEEEERFLVHFILDVSRSMDWGSANKLAFALRLVAALGYVGLVGNSRLLVTLADRGFVRSHGPVWGRREVRGLIAFLESVQPSGETDLAAALRSARWQGRVALTVLFSDLLTPTWQEGLRVLSSHGGEAVVLHTLAPEELEPPPGNDLRLVDRETGHEVNITLSREARDLYRRRLTQWLAEIEEQCGAYGLRYLRVSSDADLAGVLFHQLRARGVVR